MGAPVERTLNFGLRRVYAFELNSDGTPNGTSAATGYEGLRFQGATAYDLNIPDPRKITGHGEDGITQIAYLPPLDAMDGKLTVESADPALSALFDGTKIATIGEASAVGVGTDRQGFEPRVGLFMFQAARGLETGAVYWHSYILPSAQVIRKAGGMVAEKASTVYNIAPNRVSKHIWGTAFSASVEGFTSSQMIELWSNYPLRLAAFLGDGLEDTFLFPTDSPAVGSAGIKVWVNGVELTVGITKETSGVTFTSAPDDGDQIVILREVTN